MYKFNSCFYSQSKLQLELDLWDGSSWATPYVHTPPPIHHSICYIMCTHTIPYVHTHRADMLHHVHNNTIYHTVWICYTMCTYVSIGHGKNIRQILRTTLWGVKIWPKSNLKAKFWLVGWLVGWLVCWLVGTQKTRETKTLITQNFDMVWHGTWLKIGDKSPTLNQGNSRYRKFDRSKLW